MKKLIKIEALILLFLGLAHILYLLMYVPLSSLDDKSFYYGAFLFGVLYTCFSVALFADKRVFLYIALPINAIGLVAAITTRDTSIYGSLNNIFIILDATSVPLLAYLSWQYHKS